MFYEAWLNCMSTHMSIRMFMINAYQVKYLHIIWLNYMYQVGNLEGKKNVKQEEK